MVFNTGMFDAMMEKLQTRGKGGVRKRALSAVLAIVAAGIAVAGPEKIIFDSDMFTDFDDVGALACLHALADAGECEILATLSSTRGNASVAAIEIVNAYYGRADLPVGAPKGTGVLGARPDARAKVDPRAPIGCPDDPFTGDHYKYRRLAADYAKWVRHLDADDAPDANTVYRRVLAAAPDGSVVICSVGFLTNLRRLLESPPDAFSPLDGRALVARKVKKWVAMACAYPFGREYNAEHDWESSSVVLARWPTKIVFSDFDYGRDVFAGRAVAELPMQGNPVRDIFAANLPSRAEIGERPVALLRDGFSLAGRAAWDETAVLAAVRGEDGLFNIRRGIYRMVGSAGENEWVPDEANGPHLRLTEKVSKLEVGRIIDELLCRPPRRGRKQEAGR